MGVGKTTVCQVLKKQLDQSVFLDGDWCWDAHPFVVNDNTKAMVMDNICHLLNNFIHCPSYQHIIFGWVMHEQGIIDEIVANLDLNDCEVYAISLICSEQALINRLSQDVVNGIRDAEVIERSVQRLDLYDQLATIKIDVSNLSVSETANKIMTLAQE